MIKSIEENFTNESFYLIRNSFKCKIANKNKYLKDLSNLELKFIVNEYKDSSKLTKMIFEQELEYRKINKL